MMTHRLVQMTHKRLLPVGPTVAVLPWGATVAVLPWGATEAHGQHLPYGSDTMQASYFADQAAGLANERGGKVLVLPAIPFGNNAQQQDQVAAIHVRTETTLAILRDVAASLKRQGIERLVIVNGHGGNDFKPMARDLSFECRVLIVVVNWWLMCPEAAKILQVPGDHADEKETSVMLAINPELVHMEDAGNGARVPFAVKELQQPGVWTPRPWTKSHPDLTSGDPSHATSEKGRKVCEAVTAALAELLLKLSLAKEVP